MLWFWMKKFRSMLNSLLFSLRASITRSQHGLLRIQSSFHSCSLLMYLLEPSFLLTDTGHLQGTCQLPGLPEQMIDRQWLVSFLQPIRWSLLLLLLLWIEETGRFMIDSVCMPHGVLTYGPYSTFGLGLHTYSVAHKDLAVFIPENITLLSNLHRLESGAPYHHVNQVC